jgi:hypothetical protein
VVSSDRTEWIVTNDLSSQDSAQDTPEVRGVLWKIEEFHREIKQLTGIESCRCRAGRIQRNHIACALLWSGRASEELGLPQWTYHLPNQAWFAP